MSIKTQSIIVPADAQNIARAASLLRDGKPIAFPTETVYGLGANALYDFAVSTIFALKKRPHFNPLIVHVFDTQEAHELVSFNNKAEALVEAFWPGPLTLVLPRREPSPLALLVSAGLKTAAVRISAHEITRALVEASGVPVAAPSANRSGRVSPTSAADVAEDLGEDLTMILDGGACPIGLESTVIGFSGETPVLLRPGAVPRAAVERVVGPLSLPETGNVFAPGMLSSHYAPLAKMRLNAKEVEPGEALLAFGPNVPQSEGPVHNLSTTGDLTEAAANLFSMLRKLDKTGARIIAVMPIPQTGLGEAINDRLARAAAPRP